MTDAEMLELTKEAISSLQVHKGAHAMWRQAADVLPDTDYGEPCQYCGLTWQSMAASLRRGVYACSYAAERPYDDALEALIEARRKMVPRP